MKILMLPIALLLLLSPAEARADVRLGISIGLPVAPHFEYIGPGIRVVTGFEEEVFLQGGWYWCRRSDGWYRSRQGQSHYRYVETRRVPRGLRRMPEGHYRHWRKDGHGRMDNRRNDRHPGNDRRDRH